MKSTIVAENISKKYVLNHCKPRYTTVRDSIGNLAKNLLTSCSRSSHRDSAFQQQNEDFWALQDVSFSLYQGQRLGIIGRNGAGKSTLLKILSRVIQPTSGRASISGRVASLLEVGTGFHPELTGRENIFFNGSLLGMRRQEILHKFDEIVAFAEVEKFLDTPLKRYSSGMYVRLAFAVAAHLEPEVLIVDEVLAVGDAEFQKKSLGKMREVSCSEGRTILFVSHNMSAIEALCDDALYLKKGRNQFFGQAREVVQEYLRDVRSSSSVGVSEREDRSGKGMIRVVGIDVKGPEGHESCAVGEDIFITLILESSYAQEYSVRVSMSIRDTADVGLMACDTSMTGEVLKLEPLTRSVVTCRMYSPPLNFGEYMINISILKDELLEDYVPSAAKICINNGTFHDHVKQLSFPVLTRFTWGVNRDRNG